MKRLTPHAVAFVVFGTLAIPFIAFASDNFVPLTQLPGISAISGIGNSPSVPAFINNLYKIAIGLAAIFAVVEIIWAGFIFATSADSVSQNSKARAKITNAVIGLIIVLSPYIVFSIINPKILNLDLNFGNLQSKNGTGANVTDQQGLTGTAAVQQNICKPYQQSGAKVAFVTLSGSQTCSDAKGKGWAAVPGCCSGDTPAGQTCCGYDPANDQTPTQTNSISGPASFSIAYQDSAYLSDKDTTQKACVAYSDQSFSDVQTCLSAFNKTISATKGTYAIGKLCTESSTHSLTPSGSATILKKLPSCPN